MGTFNSYDFENRLQDDFFIGNDPEEINQDIERRLETDAAFAEQYETWITGSGYNSWHDYYKEKEAEQDAEWDNLLPDEEEADDGLTDYLDEE